MSKSTPAIKSIAARAVVTPMARPVKNAFGVIDVAPLLWLGWIADRIGAHNATAVTGVLGLLAMAATWNWWKEI